MISHLCKRGSLFLGSHYPILGGAMSWVSDSLLTASISNAGGFGVLASGAMSPDLLREEILRTQQKTSHSFGVNLIVMHPLLDQMIDACHDVSYIVLAGGIPSQDHIHKIKNLGAKVIAFAPALSFAQRLIRFGIDALVIEGHEAGGHVGSVSTSVLAQEILPVIREIPVFVAGGIGNGEAMASYMLMGASGCQLGTRFVCAYESPAHPNFKKAFIKAKARDATLSVQLDERFPVIPVRALSNKAMKIFMTVQAETIQKYEQGLLNLKEAQLEIEHFWAGSLRRSVQEGDTEMGSVMAGQSVGFVTHEQSVKEIIDELVHQMKDFLNRWFVH